MPDTLVRILTKCPFCHGGNVVNVPRGGYHDWREGELIQKALPTLSVDERELLITGICNSCFPSEEKI